MDPSLSSDTIASLMRSNFSIARQAATTRNGKGKESTGVVLSLGPYGATLYPGQE
jgi:S-methylmethionine-dependent homocysteine/selenocysteine methylase